MSSSVPDTNSDGEAERLHAYFVRQGGRMATDLRRAADRIERRVEHLHVGEDYASVVTAIVAEVRSLVGNLTPWDQLVDAAFAADRHKRPSS